MTLRALISTLCLLSGPLAALADAGQVTVLKSFFDMSGQNPNGALVLSDGVLYGTNSELGPATAGNDPIGNVFRIDTDGTGYQILKQFGQLGLPYGPSGSLVLDGGTLYATHQRYGAGTAGLVFAVNTDGSGYGVVHQFADTGWPVGGVIRDGSTLYGATTALAAVFKVNMDGSGYQKLANLPDNWGISGGVVLVGSTLYGMTTAGGTNDLGIVYKVNTDATGYEVLHSFAGGATDGATPWYGDLVSDGSSLYGTTGRGGSADKGTVFKIDPDGSDFQLLHTFTGADGQDPQTGLTLVGSTLYGATGSPLNIFRINTDGTGFETLYQATGTGAPGTPFAPLTPGGPNVFYGTTRGGGANRVGTVFMFVVPEPSALALLAIGLAGVVTIVRRRRSLIARSVRPRVLSSRLV